RPGRAAGSLGPAGAAGGARGARAAGAARRCSGGGLSRRRAIAAAGEQEGGRDRRGRNGRQSEGVGLHGSANVARTRSITTGRWAPSEGGKCARTFLPYSAPGGCSPDGERVG